MAPARATRQTFPVPLPTPARALVAAHRDYQERQAALALRLANAEREAAADTEPDVGSEAGDVESEDDGAESEGGDDKRKQEPQKPINFRSRLPMPAIFSVPSELEPDFSVLRNGKKRAATRTELEAEIESLRLQLCSETSILSFCPPG